MGDRGVTQQTLDVGLAQRQQVAGKHRQEGDHAHQGEQPAVLGHRRKEEETHQQGEDGRLADRGKKGRDRCRSAFVDVGRPDMEGHQRQLEGQRHQDHAHAHEHPGMAGSRRSWRRGSQAFVVQVAGGGVEQRHAEQQEGGGRARQHHVLEAGLQRLPLAVGVGDHAVQRHRQQFQADEQRGEVVAGDQRHAAEHRRRDEDIELLAVVVEHPRSTSRQRYRWRVPRPESPPRRTPHNRRRRTAA